MGLSESFFRLMKVAPRVSRPYLILLGMEGGPFLLGAFEQSELRPQYAFEQSENEMQNKMKTKIDHKTKT